MKVFIITEAGKKVGFGHLTRCTSLYDAFKENDIDAGLIVDGDKSCAQVLRKKRYQMLNWLEDNARLFKIIKDADIAVIDSYLAKEEFYKELSKQANLAVYIDDNKRIDYPRGIVVNFSVYGRELAYPKKKDVRYILGPEFALLRREFWNTPPKKINKLVKSILLTFGGNDSKGMTLKILNKINADYPLLTKYVAIGHAFSYVKQLKEISDKRTSFIYSPDAETMKRFMLKSDIAISAGGQTLYELARTQTPTIAICVAENQRLALEAWNKKGFIKYIGWYQKAVSRISKTIKSFMPIKERKKSSEIAKRTIDGQGAKKLVKKLLKFNKASGILLKSLSNKDMVDLFNWRNNSEVRKNFFNSHRITWEEHKKWFERITNLVTASVYVAFQREEKIGTIRYEDKGNFISVSVMLNPTFIGKGLGHQIIMLGTERFTKDRKPLKPIVAEIKKENLASIKAFTRAGYKKNEKVYIFNPKKQKFCQ